MRRTALANRYGRTIHLMKLPRLEKKLRVGLQWALDVVFRRDLGQYITLQDVESLNRLLEAARQSDGIPPETSATSSQHADSSQEDRIMSPRLRAIVARASNLIVADHRSWRILSRPLIVGAPIVGESAAVMTVGLMKSASKRFRTIRRALRKCAVFCSIRRCADSSPVRVAGQLFWSVK